MTTELKKIVKLRMIEVVIKFTGTTKQERLQICADDYHRDAEYAIFSSWIKKHKENHPYPIYHFARGIFENHFQHYAAEESTTKMNDIYTKSHFSGWHKKTEIEALEFAKWLIRAITTCKNNTERLVIVNNRLRGIQFTLNDLQMRND